MCNTDNLSISHIAVNALLKAINYSQKHCCLSCQHDCATSQETRGATGQDFWISDISWPTIIILYILHNQSYYMQLFCTFFFKRSLSFFKKYITINTELWTCHRGRYRDYLQPALAKTGFCYSDVWWLSGWVLTCSFTFTPSMFRTLFCKGEAKNQKWQRLNFNPFPAF